MFLCFLAVVALIAGFVLMFAWDGELRFGGIIAFFVAVVLAILSCVSTIPTGHTGILTTFGRVEEAVLPNGVNFHAPWQNVEVMSNKEQTFTETNVAFSKDLQEVTYTYTIKYNLSPASAPAIYKSVGTDYFNILIKPQVNNSIKSQFGLCEAESMTETRDAIQKSINDSVAPYADKYGISVQVFLDDFDFTDVYTNAIEAKQVAEQDALRDKTQQAMLTEQTRQAAERARIEAESAAEIARINAEADLEVQKINADASEYAGQKEAAANQAISNSLTAELIQYQYALRWNGVLPAVQLGDGVTPILNLSDVQK